MKGLGHEHRRGSEQTNTTEYLDTQKTLFGEGSKNTFEK